MSGRKRLFGQRDKDDPFKDTDIQQFTKFDDSGERRKSKEEQRQAALK